MSKLKTQYVCQNCGFSSPRWLGRCTSCDSWSTLVEERIGSGSGSSSGGSIEGHHESSLSTVREEFRGYRGGASELARDAQSWVSLADPVSELDQMERYNTGMQELDRALGGGLVVDSFTLLGGDPGIGKSTLLLQMAQGLIQKNPQIRVLYVSGEESVDQIRGRAWRLGVGGHANLFVAAETVLEKVFGTIKELKPDVVVLDSLQTFSSNGLASAPGSVGQVREITAKLMALAKSARIAICLVGHVTKEGSIAGPKVVEHMVDTVLYFEGEATHSYRLLRAVKNRFGSSRELGVFEMDGEGLREVLNPSSLFLNERKQQTQGTAVTCSLEGSRPLLIELQALVVPSGLAMPRRTSVGIESQRVSLLAAILERHMGIALAQQDLFFNVAGGLRISEPACDLAAAAAIWSSFEDIAIPGSWVWIGELGLTGEVRRAPQTEIRLQEAKKLGFEVAVIPANTPERALKGLKGLEILKIDRARDLPNLKKTGSWRSPDASH